MSKKINLVFYLFLILNFFISGITPVFAQSSTRCNITQDPPNLIQNSPPLVSGTNNWIKFKIVPDNKSTKYKVVFKNGFAGTGAIERGDLVPKPNDPDKGVLVQPNGDFPGLQWSQYDSLFDKGPHTFDIKRQDTNETYCQGVYTIFSDTSGGIRTCNINPSPDKPDETQSISISGTVLPSGKYQLTIPSTDVAQKFSPDSSGKVTPFIIHPLSSGDYTGTVQKLIETDYDSKVYGKGVGAYVDTNCKLDFKVGKPGQPGSITTVGQPGLPTSVSGNGCADGNPNCTSAAGQVCGTNNGEPGLQTAIGCIPTNPGALIKGLLKYSFGIGGGIAFLLMVFGAFGMITSAGNPEALKAGQERFYAAIIGLLFILLSVLLLKIIGVDLLGFGQFFGGP